MTDEMTRREAVKTTALALAAAGVAACNPTAVVSPAAQEEPVVPVDSRSTRQPAVFLPHGGGPWPFTSEPIFGGKGSWDQMERYMRGLGIASAQRPKAVLVISAHWEESVPTVMTAAKPPMLYDYSGFPPETYEVQWPAPGAPELAAEIEQMLSDAGIATASDARRGFDHGTFVPLKLAFPEADVPTLQLSLTRGLDPAEHLAIGRVLAPLRDRGVFLVGSGMSYHNMRAFGRLMRGDPAPRAQSKAFDDWLQRLATRSVTQRDADLVAWADAPAARACHPREEHLLPLHVIAGAAADDAATVPYRDVILGAHVCAMHFG
jgi:aromatic ring-opening dioxygenase catalytic subunit (LigB family)